MHITTRFLVHLGREFNSNPLKSRQNNGNDIISKNVIWNNGGLLYVLIFCLHDSFVR
jgi:hypothetical protein